MFAVIFIVCAAILLAGYKFYGAFMAGVYKLDDSKPTPAERLNDNMDYVPTHPAILLGHHFSSIAGAGPITGPILASSIFGWVPTLIWCMVGCVFLGGPHDMGALVASIRHDGNSVGVIIEKWIGKTGKKLFLCFTILTLVLVVAVFIAMTTGTFVADPVVAFVSCLYIVIAIIAGLCIYHFHANFKIVTVVMLIVVAYCSIYGGNWAWVTAVFTHDANFWNAFLGIYVLAASTLPVWLLLQPRDYLASFFLYFAVIIGAIGMVLGSKFNSGMVPAFASNVTYLGMSSKALWPCLFTMVACGAISGFHSLVGSGTTAKQISRETDALPIGYGSMLLEGIVAVIAVGTIMVAGTMMKGGPVPTFAAGFGKFASLIGIDEKLGVRLGMIAVNTFLLTSLDTSNRLCRYQIQEISNKKIGLFPASLVPIILALCLVYVKTTDASGKVIAAWAVIWPVFGASNQLVAAIALLSIGVWVIRGLKKRGRFLMIPFWFMICTSVFALIIGIYEEFAVKPSPNYLLSGISVILIVLALLLVKEGLQAIKQDKTQG